MAFAIQDNTLGAIDLYTSDYSGPGAYSLAGVTLGKMGRYEYPSAFVDAVDPLLGGGFFTFAQVAPFAAQTISSITISGNTATLTTASAHGLSVGACIQIAGAAPAGYNGLWAVATVPSTTTLTFNANQIVDPRWNPCVPNIPLVANPNLPTVSATTVGTYVPGIGAGQVVQFTHAKETATGGLILQAQPWTGTANSGLSLGVALAQSLATTTTSNPAGAFGGQYGWFQVGGASAVYVGAGTPAIGNQTYFNAGGGSSLGGSLQVAAVASKQMQGSQFCSALGASFGPASGVGSFTLPSNMALIWGTFPLAQGAIT